MDWLLILGKNYWAKDLIFLTTSHGSIGVQAWIDRYLGLRPSGESVIMESPLGNWFLKKSMREKKNEWKGRKKNKKKKTVVGRIRTCAGRAQ